MFFRLVGGDSHLSGRVELFNKGVWGTICDDYFQLEEADMICKYMGFR